MPPFVVPNVPVKLVIMLEVILIKSLDTLLQNITHFSPLAIVTPVVYDGPVVYPRTTIAYPPDVELLTTYILLDSGQLIFLIAVLDPVHNNCIY